MHRVLVGLLHTVDGVHTLPAMSSRVVLLSTCQHVMDCAGMSHNHEQLPRHRYRAFTIGVAHTAAEQSGSDVLTSAHTLAEMAHTAAL